MAFVRRHRMVLVPLFSAAILAIGLLLLLRSGSEEPTEVGTFDPVVTSERWEEVVECRNDHMREWRVVREAEWTDPETGETVTDESISTVREVGSNLCYRDGEGRWAPTVAEWEAVWNGFKIDRSNHKLYFGLTLGTPYVHVVRGHQLAMRPNSLWLSDGTQSVLIGVTDPSVVGCVDPHDPSKLVFPDAFGREAGADLEFIFEKSAFHQNVVLRAPIPVPDGMDAEQTKLYVYTEIALDDVLLAPEVKLRFDGQQVVAASDGAITPQSEDKPIEFCHVENLGKENERELPLIAFAASDVFDGADKATRAERQLWRDPSNSQTYLVERLPCSFLDEAAYPVTLDYQTISSAIADDTVWRADATYYVSAAVNVGSGKTLTIEPGTVVKFDSDASITTGSGARIVAQGEAYNYIVFTSKNDDASGEKISGSSGTPQAADYDEPIHITSDGASDCVVEYCKIGYAGSGLYVEQDIGTARNCIIHTCTTGLYLRGATMPDAANNLIYECSYGIDVYVFAPDGPSLTIRNNTIDDCSSTGIYLHADSSSYGGSYDIRNNLVSNAATGISRAGAVDGTFTLSHNGYWNNTSDLSGTLEKSDPVQIDASDNPYDASPLGNYYLDRDGDGAALVYAGSETYEEAGLDEEAFTTDAPEVVPTSISTSVWSKKPSGANWSGLDVSIGYHHNRIDYVVNNEICEVQGGATLVIAPGTVVAFSGNSANLCFDDAAEDDAYLICNGKPDEFVILAGKPAVSMNVEAQFIDGGWTYNVKGILLNDPSSAAVTASITYTRVMALHKGIDIQKSSESEVRHCVFERGQTSLHVDSPAGCAIEVADCLFRYNRRGAIVKLNNTGTTWHSTNCTFDRNEIGLVLDTTECNGAAEVTDCLFSNAAKGIQISHELGAFTHGHNAYYECTHEIWKSYDTSEWDLYDTNSPVLEDSPYDTAAHWTWAQLWYLDQSQTAPDGCINGGSQNVDSASLTGFPTKLDQTADSGTVDIGYHYPDTTPTWRVLVKNDSDVVQGLVAYWPLDEDATDYSQSETGTRVNGTVTEATSVDGIRGMAYSFDGTNDNIEFNAASGGKLDITQKLTLEAWGRPDTTGAHEGIAIKTTSAGDVRYGLRLSNYGTEYQAAVELNTAPDPTVVQATSANTLTTEEWTHLTATFDGSVLRLYQDGAEVGWTVADMPIKSGSGDKFWIGSVSSGSYFDGIIDEVKVYDRCLSAWEVSCVAGGVDYIVYTNKETIGPGVNAFGLPLIIPDDVRSLYVETYDATYENPNGTTIANPLKFTSLQDGINIVTIYGRDLAGNLSEPTEVMIVWDNEAPEITDEDVDYTDIHPGGDDGAFETTTITADFGEDVNYIIRIWSDATVLWTASGTGSWFEQEWDGGGHGTGDYLLDICATDLAGNSAVLWTRAIRIDDEDPPPVVLENIGNVTSTSFDVFWKNPSSWDDPLRLEIYLSQVDMDTLGHDWDSGSSMLIKVIDWTTVDMPYSYTVDNLTPDSTYYVKIITRDTAGNPTPCNEQKSVTTVATKDLFGHTWTMKGSSSDDASFENSATDDTSYVALDGNVTVDSDGNDPGLVRLADGGGPPYVESGTATFFFAVDEDSSVVPMRWRHLECHADQPANTDIVFEIAVGPDNSGSAPSTWTAVGFPAASWPLDGIDTAPTPDVTPDETRNEKHARLLATMGSGNLVTGRFGNAFSFDGSGEYLTAPDGGTDDPLDITGDITLEAWVRFDTTSATQTILAKAKDDFSGSVYRLAWEPGTPDYLHFDYQGDSFAAEWTPETDQWYHLAAVYDSSADPNEEASLYVNGVLLARGELTPSSPPQSNNRAVAIAAREYSSGSFDQHFDGELDDVAIHPRALSAFEVSIHAHEGLDLDGFAFDPSDWIRVTATLTGPGTATPKLYDLSIVYSDMSLDVDNDGLDERGERTAGSDLYNHDTDDDGLRDGFEVTYGFDPTDAYSIDPNDLVNDGDCNWECDEDDWTNKEEQARGTNPLNWDQNGNSIPDSIDEENGLDVNGTDVTILDFGPGSEDPDNPDWVTTPEIEVSGGADSTLAWAIVTVNDTEVRPHITNNGDSADLLIEKVPLDEGVNELKLKVHNIYSDELESGDPGYPEGYAEQPEAEAGPLYVGYDPNVSVSLVVENVDPEESVGSSTIDPDERIWLTAGRSNRVLGEATISLSDESDYSSALIVEVRTFINGVERDLEVPATPQAVVGVVTDYVDLRRRVNTVRMKAKVEITPNGGGDPFFRTYIGPLYVVHFNVCALIREYTTEHHEHDVDPSPMLQQYFRWYEQFSDEWYDSPQFPDWPPDAGGQRWRHETWIDGEKVLDEGWFYGGVFSAWYVEFYERIDFISGPVDYEEYYTNTAKVVFQMPPHRCELLSPSAVIDVCSGTSILGCPVAEGSYVKYAVLDGLRPYDETGMSGTPEGFDYWEPNEHITGYECSAGGENARWFYVLIEKLWTIPSGENKPNSLIPNYFNVESMGSSPLVITTDAQPDDNYGGPYFPDYDWTEYAELEVEPTTLATTSTDPGTVVEWPEVSIISGLTAGEDDFVDDDGEVDVDLVTDWDLPSGVAGQVIEIPLNVEYHWPEAEAEVTTADKKIYGQKGVVVRVQVPEEIWAGESRPLFAVLNGPYNDGVESKAGDIPWTYEIEWQFVEPVWEEKVEEGETVYEPRPPETEEERVPSTILTGDHRIKHDTSPLYLADMTSEGWGLAYVRAVIKNVNIDSGEVVEGSGSTDVMSVWVAVSCLEELTVRSSETGEEIDGVSLYLPDDGTDRGEPHFKYNDPLYGLGISLPAGLTTEVDTMVTSWHNNMTYLWDDIILTETGAETNVFSYNEGGLEITVTLDDGAVTTAEFDAFGATVYRSDQVDPARRTFFEETDEDTNEFSSFTFAAQIVLVDGLSASDADIIQVMLFSSTSSESYSFIATEDGANTKRFVGQDGLWFVDFPPAFMPTANVDEAIITAFGLATTEPQELQVRETGPETNVLVTMEYIDSEDTDYPEPSTTTFHCVEVTRWPGICGDEHAVIGVSGDEFYNVPATFQPSVNYATPNIMIIPEGHAAPDLSGSDEFVCVIQDASVAKRLSRVLSWFGKSSPDCMVDPDVYDEDLLYAYFTEAWNRTISGQGKVTEEEAREAFVRLSLLGGYEGSKFLKAAAALECYGVDLVANCRHWGDSPDKAGSWKVASTLHSELGHNVIWDRYLTHLEVGQFFADRITEGTSAPVVYVITHGFWNPIVPTQKPKEKYALKLEWLKQVISQASKGSNNADSMRIRMLVISGCDTGASIVRLEEWGKATKAFSTYGATASKTEHFDSYAMRFLYRLHVMENGKSKLWPAHYPTITGSVADLNSELKKAYSVKDSSDYDMVNKCARIEYWYGGSNNWFRTRSTVKAKPLLNGFVHGPGSGLDEKWLLEANDTLDWRYQMRKQK
jgi:hypothetical protein